jgi:hypothetical protein
MPALSAPADLTPDRRAMSPERPRDLAVALSPTDPDENSLALLERQPMRRTQNSPSHQRRLILNMAYGGVRQAELGHHLTDPCTTAKPRHYRRALRRRQQPITPAPTPSLDHLLRSDITKKQSCCADRINPPNFWLWCWTCERSRLIQARSRRERRFRANRPRTAHEPPTVHWADRPRWAYNRLAVEARTDGTSVRSTG